MGKTILLCVFLCGLFPLFGALKTFSENKNGILCFFGCLKALHTKFQVNRFGFTKFLVVNFIYQTKSKINFRLFHIYTFSNFMQIEIGLPFLTPKQWGQECLDCCRLKKSKCFEKLKNDEILEIYEICLKGRKYLHVLNKIVFLLPLWIEMTILSFKFQVFFYS